MYIHIFAVLIYKFKLKVMKNLKTLSFAILFSSGIIAGNGQNQGDEYAVNKKVSSIEWVGKKVTGSHNGTIKIKDGLINVEDGKIINGNLTIDMNSIVVLDLEDPETNAKLHGHLMSDDFFGVEKHPEAFLKINKVELIEGTKHHIHGELTIKDHSEKVEIPATILSEGNKIVAAGEIKIDRTKYGIKYGSGSFFDDLGDKAIDNEFIVKFKVASTK